jgi:hypothetical protein
MKPGIELVRLIAVILITFTHTRNHLESGFTYFVVEELPKYGTAILSIISGYLYYTISRHKTGLFDKKIKSLVIPYLIANFSILFLVLIFNYGFGYNPLNRLSYDWSIIFEGLFSLNSPPINPPTYFIRDIFILFSIIALITQKEWKALLVLIPFLLFGKLIIRWDIAFLFVSGIIYAMASERLNKNILLSICGLSIVVVVSFFDAYLKFPVALFLFMLTVDLKIKYLNTGRFSYLLHLYHSPVMVITYPIISYLISDATLRVVTQIIWAIAMAYLLFLTTKKIPALKILSGGR